MRPVELRASGHRPALRAVGVVAEIERPARCHDEKSDQLLGVRAVHRRALDVAAQHRAGPVVALARKGKRRDVAGDRADGREAQGRDADARRRCEWVGDSHDV